METNNKRKSKLIIGKSEDSISGGKRTYFQSIFDAKFKCKKY